jgi:peptide/nickel transport system substrate-binding protein
MLRRVWTVLLASILLASFVGACAAKPTEQVVVPTETQAGVTTPSTYGEAPMLADLVAQGQLPPVEERLPSNPLVVTNREIGTYGGTVRMMHQNPDDILTLHGWIRQHFLRFSDQDFKTLEPNLFVSWEGNTDGTIWTLKLREGMKWSDGVAVTTEDVRFWYEDIMQNKDITPYWYDKRWNWGGEPMKLEIIDIYTFKVTFVKPLGDFALLLAQDTPKTAWLVPSHYLKPFHITYRPQAELDALVTAGGFTSWVQLFKSKNGSASYMANYDPALPVLYAWRLAEKTSDGTLIYDRNPYFWMVDEAGNQLPYIDHLRVTLVSNVETANLQVLQGELDYLGTDQTGMASYPLFKMNETEDGPYIIQEMVSTGPDRYVLYPNLNNADPLKLAVVQHPDFVKALSMAINREEINLTLFFGLAKMGQANVLPGQPMYIPEASRAWADFNQEQANVMLDAAGLQNKDAEGFRLLSNGERFTYNIVHPGSNAGPAAADFAELVVSQWREVGIDASSEEVDINKWIEVTSGVEWDCTMWFLDAVTAMRFPISPWVYPILSTQTSAPAWGMYYETDGQAGEQPPEWIQARRTIHDQMIATVSDSERNDLAIQLLQLNADRPYLIGTVEESPYPIIFNKSMGNLPPAGAPYGFDTAYEFLYYPAAFFFK